MDIYSIASLTVSAKRTEPDVWIRRVVIFRQLSPQPVQIREIKLSKGVNIVWAEETDDESAPAEITGHSAGKTSFCRLMRYLLGEKTYGTKANMSSIQKTFPGGYVAAEINVREKQWAVLRPIGNGRSSYVKQEATIEQLVMDRSSSATQDDYPVKLGFNALLDEMDAGAVLRTNRAIEWGHVLAWCTRDQEARFQNCYEWRSPRSESEWPSFRSSKADPLFVMRIILGLFLPNELIGEEELANLIQEHEELERKLPTLRQEPRFRVNLYEKELRARLRALFPLNPDIEVVPFHSGDLFASDLDRLTTNAKSQVGDRIKKKEDEVADIVREIELIAAQIGVVQHNEKQLEAMYGMGQSVQSELADGVNQRQTQRERFEKAAHEMCVLGGVLYGECPIVLDRQQGLQISSHQDANAIQEMEAKKTEFMKKLNQQREEYQNQLTVLRKQRTDLQDKKKVLDEDIQSLKQSLHDINSSHKKLTEWTDKSEKPGEFKELDECRDALKQTTAQIEAMQSQLNALIVQHDSSRQLLSSIFSAAVHGVIPSGAYDGEVTLAERELNFRITHGTTMSGEAVETLAVLLADVACMVYNTVSERPHLPGFLLHDSPREADLSLRLYRRFITLAASLQNHFDTAEACPFQYIITTTTPPPVDLQGDKWIKLHLNAAIPEETLFRSNIALPDESQLSLFVVQPQG